MDDVAKPASPPQEEADIAGTGGLPPPGPSPNSPSLELSAELTREIREAREARLQAKSNLEAISSVAEQAKAEAARLEESCRRTAERQAEAIRLKAEQDVADALAQMRQSVREIDASTTPRLTTMQRALEDLTARLNDVQTGQLPSWRTEVSTQVHQLRNSLEQYKDEWESQRSAAVRERKSREVQRLEQQAREQERLNAELDALRSRVASSEKRAEAIADELAQCRERLGASSSLHGEELQSAFQKLQLHGDSLERLGAGGEETKSLYSQIEKVCAQLSLELTQLRRMRVDDMADVRALLNESQERQKHQVRDDLAKSTQALQSSIRSLEERMRRQKVELSAEATAIDQRLAPQIDGLGIRLGADLSKLRDELGAKAAEADQNAKLYSSTAKLEAIELVRANQDGTFVFADAFRLAQEEHRGTVEARVCGLEERASKDRSELEDQVSKVDGAALARQEQLRNSMQHLALQAERSSEFQAQALEKMQKFQAVVTAMEIRLWPWRKNTSERQAPAILQSPRTRPGSAAGWRQGPLEPKALASEAHHNTPTSVRPSTARGHRPSDDVEPSTLVPLPVGAARTAARQLLVAHA